MIQKSNDDETKDTDKGQYTSKDTLNKAANNTIINNNPINKTI